MAELQLKVLITLKPRWWGRSVISFLPFVPKWTGKWDSSFSVLHKNLLDYPSNIFHCKYQHPQTNCLSTYLPTQLLPFALPPHPGLQTSNLALQNTSSILDWPRRPEARKPMICCVWITQKSSIPTTAILPQICVYVSLPRNHDLRIASLHQKEDIS